MHVTPERGWLNDPNGPVHAGGRFHLFFQAHPHAAAWGPPQWDHVSSADLVHWRRHPPALVPSTDGPDRDGCWSGCVRVVDGTPTAFYTGVTGSTDADRVESVCRAHALDGDLDRWRADPSPLVRSGTGFRRDPFVWQDGEGWHLLLGVAGGVDHYASADAEHWRRTGSFWSSDEVGGRHWECPQLLRLPEADVLVLSVQAGTHDQPVLRVVHAVGRARGGRFSGRLAGPLEHGDALYAPAVTADPSGRWLLWAWVRELAPPDVLPLLGRVGALSVPLTCDLEAGRLVLRPVRELAALRGQAQPLGDRPASLPRPGEVEATLGDGRLVLGLSPDGDERVVLERRGSTLLVDRSAASRAPWAPDEPLQMPVAVGPRRVRVLLDGSVLVVCVDGRLAAVTRVYPTSAEAGQVNASGDVTAARVYALSVDDARTRAANHA